MHQKEIYDYVLDLLKNYNTMKREQESLQFERSRLEQMKAEETIEAMTFSSSQEERVDSGGISNKTADIALNYKQCHVELKARLLSEVDSRLRWINDTLERLDFYIGSLEAHQASILRDYYFEGYTWRELQDLRGVTDKTLMKHRNDAVKALVLKYSRLKSIGLL